jgi:hypothetical protein
MADLANVDKFGTPGGRSVGIVHLRTKDHGKMVSSGLLRRVEPHGVTTQKTPFFIVTAVRTSNLTRTTEFVFVCIS